MESAAPRSAISQPDTEVMAQHAILARVITRLLADPQPHIGKIYDLTGPQSENMHFFARSDPLIMQGFVSKNAPTFTASAQKV